MSGLGVLGLAIWVVLVAGSVWTWLPRPRFGTALLGRTSVLIGVVAAEVLISIVIAACAAASRPMAGGWSWLAIGVGACAVVICGGTTASSVLGLADQSARSSGTSAQRTVLRGGAWIGGLERLALFGTVLAGWPAGLAAVVAIKAFARFPELSSGQATGAIERFIIGTFTSLGWAAICTGMTWLWLH